MLLELGRKTGKRKQDRDRRKPWTAKISSMLSGKKGLFLLGHMDTTEESWV